MILFQYIFEKVLYLSNIHHSYSSILKGRNFFYEYHKNLFCTHKSHDFCIFYILCFCVLHWNKELMQLRHYWDTFGLFLRFPRDAIERQLRCNWDAIETQLGHKWGFNWHTIEMQLRWIPVIKLSCICSSISSLLKSVIHYPHIIIQLLNFATKISYFEISLYLHNPSGIIFYFGKLPLLTTFWPIPCNKLPLHQFVMNL